ncbi:hypothetical protein DFH09DRAFT_1095612 [Mycena vulgaris]|nr:hypothetical protein DFH09DRAFT_1095612 [Mycena vulgaris]
MSPPHVDYSKCDWVPSYLKALTLEYTITLFSPHANNGRPPATSHYREHTREQDGCTVLVPPPATRAGPDLPPPYTPGPATASAAGALPAPTETTLDFNIPTNTNVIGATQVNMSGASELTDSTCEDATTNRAVCAARVVRPTATFGSSTVPSNHRQCQTTDYKIGRPPTQPAHKLSCGKTHVEEPADESLAVVIRQLDRGDIKLYTKSPTTALQAQIQGKGGELFLQMRAEAMERRELASIALMEKLLAMSTLPTDLYKVGDYVPQLEQEYEIDLEECHFALQRSVRHRELFDEWLTWTTPRIRDGAPGLGVRFGLPWYYLDPPGEFTHPVKYGGQVLRPRR